MTIVNARSFSALRLALASSFLSAENFCMLFIFNISRKNLIKQKFVIVFGARTYYDYKSGVGKENYTHRNQKRECKY